MELGMKVAALTVLRDMLDAELETARHDLEKHMRQLQDAYGVKSLEVKAANEVVASATLAVRSTGAVIDSEAFMAWVETNYPERIETIKRIDPTWQKSILADVIKVNNDSTEVAWAKTGEFVEGVVVPDKTTLQVRFKSEGREKVAALFGNGVMALSDLVMPAELEVGESEKA